MEQLALRIAPLGKLLRAWPLRGGVSAQVTGIEIALGDGGTRKLVVRQHGERDLAANAHVAAHEFKLLHHLGRAGLPAPRPVYLGESCELLPTRYVVVEYIEGETDFEPTDVPGYVAQMATVLSEIHRIDTSGLGFLRRANEPRRGLSSPNPDVLLHGDYWPGNILWRDGKLTGVIDWEDARLGDPLADVANARLEIRWALGVRAMNDFTQRYRDNSAAGFADLPRWDIAAAERKGPRVSEWGLAGDVQQKMRDELELFVAEASARIGS